MIPKHSASTAYDAFFWRIHTSLPPRSPARLQDATIGNCDCIPGRDIPDLIYSAHFSCMQNIRKPGDYDTEHEMMYRLYNQGSQCVRYYYTR